MDMGRLADAINEKLEERVGGQIETLAVELAEVKKRLAKVDTTSLQVVEGLAARLGVVEKVLCEIVPGGRLDVQAIADETRGRLDGQGDVIQEHGRALDAIDKHVADVDQGRGALLEALDARLTKLEQEAADKYFVSPESFGCSACGKVSPYPVLWGRAVDGIARPTCAACGGGAIGSIDDPVGTRDHVLGVAGEELRASDLVEATFGADGQPVFRKVLADRAKLVLTDAPLEERVLAATVPKYFMGAGVSLFDVLRDQGALPPRVEPLAGQFTACPRCRAPFRSTTEKLEHYRRGCHAPSRARLAVRRLAQVVLAAGVAGAAVAIAPDVVAMVRTLIGGLLP